MKNQIMNYWDTIDRIRLANSICLVQQGRLDPRLVVRDTIRNELIKTITRNLFNIR